ncbi:MAG TPA: hypothetical protein VI968_03735 [archaeon]|nr:hypothetical protein [archaeon]
MDVFLNSYPHPLAKAERFSEEFKNKQIMEGRGMCAVAVERTGERRRIADMEGYEFKAEIFEPTGVRNINLITVPRRESDFYTVRHIEFL